MAGLKIGDKVLGDSCPCFVIAEIGHNHQGNVETCKKMFKAAKDCGADAVKLQKRDNRSLYTEAFYNSPYNSENAYGPTYGAHREALEFGWDQNVELKEYARYLGLVFFATPFDFSSADFLERLEVPCHKTASGDLRNIPLLRHVAQFGKPMIVSTGGSTTEDIVRAYEEIMPINQQLALLHCTAMYPITDEHEDKVNLKMIETLRRYFPGVVVGFSDHSNGVLFSTAAYIYGAGIIERHFTLKRTMRGTDHAFSLEPQGMRKLVEYLRRLRVGMGDGEKTFYEEEKSAIRKMAKMIVAAKDLSVGHVLGLEDVCLKSPADGLEPYLVDDVVGKRLTVSVKKDQPLFFQDLI